MRCACGFSDDPENIRHAKVEHGHLRCPYCAGQIACEPTMPGLRTSAEAYMKLAPIVRRRKQESFWVFYVDARNRTVGKREICRGSLTACIVHPREVFGPAYLKHAAAIVLAHNHPSGDVTPSPEDEALTNRLVQAGQMLGIPVLDHLIIGANNYFSFRDHGKIHC